MIDPDKCNAVYLLHQEGMPVREISRRLNISRNTVRRIVKQKRVVSPSQREDKIQIDRELLERVYRDCEHWIQRVHEKLLEEEGIQIGYSTLTRLLDELEISKPPKTRCDRVPDVPGEEMQHDTTVYRVKLSGQKTKVIASLLYLRYSKRKYLKFYRVFNRFAMKCFLHEALMHWSYAAKQGIIDNTNLARLRGTGKNAVIVPDNDAATLDDVHCSPRIRNGVVVAVGTVDKYQRTGILIRRVIKSSRVAKQLVNSSDRSGVTLPARFVTQARPGFVRYVTLTCSKSQSSLDFGWQVERMDRAFPWGI